MPRRATLCNMTRKPRPERFQRQEIPASLGAATDGRPGNLLAVMVSDGFWRRRLGARADAVGKPIRLDGSDYTVAGVLPRDTGPLEQNQEFFTAAQWDTPPIAGLCGRSRRPSHSDNRPSSDPRRTVPSGSRHASRASILCVAASSDRTALSTNTSPFGVQAHTPPPFSGTRH